VKRRNIHALGVALLDDPAAIHDADAIADMPHDREIVRDKQIADARFLLQILKQIDDLALRRDVERTHGLVEHDQVRLDRERACDRDTLALSA
jgi:hypothetical protein